MPNGNHDYAPDLETISSFFGANDNGNSQIPSNWTNRVAPYTNMDVVNQILAMYLLDPVLFGGETANGTFDVIDFGSIKGGSLTDAVTPSTLLCTIYQLATERVPSSLNGFITPTVDAIAFAIAHLNPQFENFGCVLRVS